MRERDVTDRNIFGKDFVKLQRPPAEDLIASKLLELFQNQRSDVRSFKRSEEVGKGRT